MPAVGRVLMMTAFRSLAGLSVASAKPKSAAEKVLLPSSGRVIVALVPVGASLTGVTLIVSVASTLVSMPPLVVPPLSCTLKPIVA